MNEFDYINEFFRPLTNKFAVNLKNTINKFWKDHDINRKIK